MAHLPGGLKYAALDFDPGRASGHNSSAADDYAEYNTHRRRSYYSPSRDAIRLMPPSGADDTLDDFEFDILNNQALFDPDFINDPILDQEFPQQPPAEEAPAVARVARRRDNNRPMPLNEQQQQLVREEHQYQQPRPPRLEYHPPHALQQQQSGGPATAQAESKYVRVNNMIVNESTSVRDVLHERAEAGRSKYNPNYGKQTPVYEEDGGGPTVRQHLQQQQQMNKQQLAQRKKAANMPADVRSMTGAGQSTQIPYEMLPRRQPRSRPRNAPSTQQLRDVVSGSVTEIPGSSNQMYVQRMRPVGQPGQQQRKVPQGVSVRSRAANQQPPKYYNATAIRPDERYTGLLRPAEHQHLLPVATIPKQTAANGKFPPMIRPSTAANRHSPTDNHAGPIIMENPASRKRRINHVNAPNTDPNKTRLVVLQKGNEQTGETAIKRSMKTGMVQVVVDKDSKNGQQTYTVLKQAAPGTKPLGQPPQSRAPPVRQIKQYTEQVRYLAPEGSRNGRALIVKREMPSNMPFDGHLQEEMVVRRDPADVMLHETVDASDGPILYRYHSGKKQLSPIQKKPAVATKVPRQILAGQSFNLQPGEKLQLSPGERIEVKIPSEGAMTLNSAPKSRTSSQQRFIMEQVTPSEDAHTKKSTTMMLSPVSHPSAAVGDGSSRTGLYSPGYQLSTDDATRGQPKESVLKSLLDEAPLRARQPLPNTSATTYSMPLRPTSPVMDTLPLNFLESPPPREREEAPKKPEPLGANVPVSLQLDDGKLKEADQKSELRSPHRRHKEEKPLPAYTITTQPMGSSTSLTTTSTHSSRARLIHSQSVPSTPGILQRGPLSRSPRRDAPKASPHKLPEPATTHGQQRRASIHGTTQVHLEPILPRSMEYPVTGSAVQRMALPRGSNPVAQQLMGTQPFQRAVEDHPVLPPRYRERRLSHEHPLLQSMVDDEQREEDPARPMSEPFDTIESREHNLLDLNVPDRLMDGTLPQLMDGIDNQPLVEIAQDALDFLDSDTFEEEVPVLGPHNTTYSRVPLVPAPILSELPLDILDGEAVGTDEKKDEYVHEMHSDEMHSPTEYGMQDEDTDQLAEQHMMSKEHSPSEEPRPLGRTSKRSSSASIESGLEGHQIPGPTVGAMLKLALSQQNATPESVIAEVAAAHAAAQAAVAAADAAAFARQSISPPNTDTTLSPTQKTPSPASLSANISEQSMSARPSPSVSPEDASIVPRTRPRAKTAVQDFPKPTRLVQQRASVPNASEMDLDQQHSATANYNGMAMPRTTMSSQFLAPTTGATTVSSTPSTTPPPLFDGAPTSKTTLRSSAPPTPSSFIFEHAMRRYDSNSPSVTPESDDMKSTPFDHMVTVSSAGGQQVVEMYDPDLLNSTRRRKSSKPPRDRGNKSKKQESIDEQKRIFEKQKAEKDAKDQMVANQIAQTILKAEQERQARVAVEQQRTGGVERRKKGFTPTPLVVTQTIEEVEAQMQLQQQIQQQEAENEAKARAKSAKVNYRMEMNPAGVAKIRNRRQKSALIASGLFPDSGEKLLDEQIVENFPNFGRHNSNGSQSSSSTTSDEPSKSDVEAMRKEYKRLMDEADRKRMDDRADADSGMKRAFERLLETDRRASRQAIFGDRYTRSRVSADAHRHLNGHFDMEERGGSASLRLDDFMNTSDGNLMVNAMLFSSERAAEGYLLTSAKQSREQKDCDPLLKFLSNMMRPDYSSDDDMATSEIEELEEWRPQSEDVLPNNADSIAFDPFAGMSWEQIPDFFELAGQIPEVFKNGTVPEPPVLPHDIMDGYDLPSTATVMPSTLASPLTPGSLVPHEPQPSAPIATRQPEQPAAPTTLPKRSHKRKAPATTEVDSTQQQPKKNRQRKSIQLLQLIRPANASSTIKSQSSGSSSPDSNASPPFDAALSQNIFDMFNSPECCDWSEAIHELEELHSVLSAAQYKDLKKEFDKMRARQRRIDRTREIAETQLRNARQTVPPEDVPSTSQLHQDSSQPIYTSASSGTATTSTMTHLPRLESRDSMPMREGGPQSVPAALTDAERMPPPATLPPRAHSAEPAPVLPRSSEGERLPRGRPKKGSVQMIGQIGLPGPSMIHPTVERPVIVNEVHAHPLPTMLPPAVPSVRPSVRSIKEDEFEFFAFGQKYNMKMIRQKHKLLTLMKKKGISGLQLAGGKMIKIGDGTAVITKDKPNKSLIFLQFPETVVEEKESETVEDEIPAEEPFSPIRSNTWFPHRILRNHALRARRLARSRKSSRLLTHLLKPNRRGTFITFPRKPLANVTTACPLTAIHSELIKLLEAPSPYSASRLQSSSATAPKVDDEYMTVRIIKVPKNVKVVRSTAKKMRSRRRKRHLYRKYLKAQNEKVNLDFLKRMGILEERTEHSDFVNDPGYKQMVKQLSRDIEQEYILDLLSNNPPASHEELRAWLIENGCGPDATIEQLLNEQAQEAVAQGGVPRNESSCLPLKFLDSITERVQSKKDLYWLKKMMRWTKLEKMARRDLIAFSEQDMSSGSEERQQLAKKLAHYERNKLRRIQTQKKKQDLLMKQITEAMGKGQPLDVKIIKDRWDKMLAPPKAVPARLRLAIEMQQKLALMAAGKLFKSSTRRGRGRPPKVPKNKPRAAPIASGRGRGRPRGSSTRASTSAPVAAPEAKPTLLPTRPPSTRRTRRNIFDEIPLALLADNDDDADMDVSPKAFEAAEKTEEFKEPTIPRRASKARISASQSKEEDVVPIESEIKESKKAAARPKFGPKNRPRESKSRSKKAKVTPVVPEPAHDDSFETEVQITEESIGTIVPFAVVETKEEKPAPVPEVEEKPVETPASGQPVEPEATSGLRRSSRTPSSRRAPPRQSPTPEPRIRKPDSRSKSKKKAATTREARTTRASVVRETRQSVSRASVPPPEPTVVVVATTELPASRASVTRELRSSVTRETRASVSRSSVAPEARQRSISRSSVAPEPLPKEKEEPALPAEEPKKEEPEVVAAAVPDEPQVTASGRPKRPTKIPATRLAQPELLLQVERATRAQRDRRQAEAVPLPPRTQHARAAKRKS